MDHKLIHILRYPGKIAYATASVVTYCHYDGLPYNEDYDSYSSISLYNAAFHMVLF